MAVTAPLRVRQNRMGSPQMVRENRSCLISVL
jgi:hypothetical protein